VVAVSALVSRELAWWERLFGERLADDEQRNGLHQALRVAIVMPLMYALGNLVLHSAPFALLAGFGSFAALAMADFTGPARSRLAALAALAVTGSVLVAIGTALSGTVWPAFVAMLVIAFALQFAMALGGQFALGNNAAMLSYVVSAMVPAGPEAIPSRVAGWLCAIAASAVAATFLWPRNERRDLYHRLAEALRPLAAAIRAVASGGAPAQPLHDAGIALERVRDEQRELGFRPIGPPGHQEALGGLVDGLAQAWRFTSVVVASERLHATDRTLAAASAATIEHAADVMEACARGRRARASVRIDVDALIEARRRHRDQMHEAASAGLRMHTSPSTIVSRIAGAYPVRIQSFVALSMAVDAAVMAGRTVASRDDFVVLEPTTPMSALRHALRTLRALLVPETAWFHNSMRAALGLAAAMAVAKAIAIGHGFWVVLATLGVLRSNVVTTGATIVNALAGTAVGFVLAVLAVKFLAPYPVVMWSTLPFVVFAAAYASHAISFGAAQALFALLVVTMFNLVEPEGWMTGVVRLEAVAIGAIVALFVSVVMWPKGATLALREQIAEHVRAAQTFVDVAFASLLGRAQRPEVDAAREEALDVRRRSDEALAAFMGERGAKRIAPEVWTALARTPVFMRLAADAVTALERGGYHGDTSAIEALLSEVRASFLAMADRLGEDATAAAEPWRPVVADLDMVGGAGARIEPILRELAVTVEAHRTDPAASRHIVAVVWGLGWLQYLAHVRMAADDALAQVVANKP
jgi:uncharacterized membrane protein YccC